jgi:response regulator RpfG family c-di-GMP phosphodiesterase
MSTAEANTPVATLLLVDDEANILAALKRLFRPQGYHVFTAESGPAGLETIEKEHIDLVISDMRMPQMSGAEFLAEVAKRQPGTVRILLTGYADLNSTIDAVNKGQIFRYVSKPWEDNDLRMTVQQGLERQHLRREHDRLTALVAKQNRELKNLNTGLEAKVVARTEEIRQTADMLELAYKDLKRSYTEAVPVFAAFAEMREGGRAGHGRRVAEMARPMAELVGMTEDDVQNVYFAALLHDIGKLGLPDALLQKPVIAMKTEERNQMMRHPVIGQAAFTALESMQGAAQLIRHHHERYDGNGYPDRLAGDNIPMGARILAMVNDFDAAQAGTLVEGRLSKQEARAFLISNRGTRYDPRILDTFIQWLDLNPDYAGNVEDLTLPSDAVRPGMTLTRDLTNQDGILLLARGRKLDERVIARLRQVEKEEDRGFTVHIKRE